MLSHLSITQSVPSSTALATSVASARVGRGFFTMLSSICVAVMTGLPDCRHPVGILSSLLVCPDRAHCKFDDNYHLHVCLSLPGLTMVSKVGGVHARCRNTSDTELPDLVALLDHHLLRQEDLLGGDLHAQVAAGNHDGVALLQDLVKVLDALLVLHLADDADAPPLGPQHLYRVKPQNPIKYLHRAVVSPLGRLLSQWCKTGLMKMGQWCPGAQPRYVCPDLWERHSVAGRQQREHGT